jgi:hypothetical protein
MIAHGFASVFIAMKSGDCSSIVIDRGHSLGTASGGLNVHHVMTEVSRRHCIAKAPTQGIAATNFDAGVNESAGTR